MRVDFTLDTNAENFVDWVQKYAEARQSEQIEYGNAEGIFTVAALETSPSGLNMEVRILVQPIDNGQRGSTFELEHINIGGIPRLVSRRVPEPLPVIPPPIIFEISSFPNVTSKVRVSAESKTVKAVDYFISLIEELRRDFPESTIDIVWGPALKLFEIFKVWFNQEDLKTLSFRLHIDYDDYSPLGKSDMARELALRIVRERKTGELVTKVGPDLRPDIDWTTIEA